MFQVDWTTRFNRRAAKFRRAHPDLQRLIANTITGLATDPWQPRLRVHALHGALAGFHAATLTQNYRIVMKIDSALGRITLTDIGSHDDVYRA